MISLLSDCPVELLLQLNLSLLHQFVQTLVLLTQLPFLLYFSQLELFEQLVEPLDPEGQFGLKPILAYQPHQYIVHFLRPFFEGGFDLQTTIDLTVYKLERTVCYTIGRGIFGEGLAETHFRVGRQMDQIFEMRALGQCNHQLLDEVAFFVAVAIDGQFKSEFVEGRRWHILAPLKIILDCLANFAKSDLWSDELDDFGRPKFITLHVKYCQIENQISNVLVRVAGFYFLRWWVWERIGSFWVCCKDIKVQLEIINKLIQSYQIYILTYLFNSI